MRAIVFRTLAGLLAVAFLAVLMAGDTSRMSFRYLFGLGAIGAGFGLYAVLGSDLGERLVWLSAGGTPGGRKPPPAGRPDEPGDASGGDPGPPQPATGDH